MRSLVQSVFARHPVVVAGATGLRWVSWLLAGHPFGPVIAFVAFVVGLPLWYQGLTLVAVEAALALWGFAGYTNGAQALYLWGHLCRFRRRWPGRFARAYDDHRFFPVLAHNYYSVPGGLRPILVAPQLSLLPRAFSYRRVGWILTPRAEHDLPTLRLATERVAAADDRIGNIEIREVRGGRLALIVDFERPGTGRSGRLAVRIGDLADPGDDGGGGLDVLSAPPPPPYSPPYRPRESDRSTDRPGVGVGTGIGVATGIGETVQIGSGDGITSGIADAVPPVAWPEPERGGSAYGGDIPGLQRFRLGDVPVRTWRRHAVVGGVVDDSGDVVDGTGGSEVSRVGLRSSQPGRVRPPMIERRRGVSLPWSFSVIVPANLLIGVAVLLTDAGPVAVIALCAGAGASIILIIAEGMSGT
ncbi:MAG: hypothetical protein OEM40_05010 [Acidimicrobiia bacterium]|nr:hypothetical protein [Acidimicrobiia bacterium]